MHRDVHHNRQLPDGAALGKKIEKALGVEADVHMVPRHPADALETWSDTSKIQGLGYKSETSIEEGVQKFVEWYLDYYKIREFNEIEEWIDTL